MHDLKMLGKKPEGYEAKKIHRVFYINLAPVVSTSGGQTVAGFLLLFGTGELGQSEFKGIKQGSNQSSLGSVLSPELPGTRAPALRQAHC